MPAKNKTSKSRTSNNKANKKIRAPRWVIAVVLLIVAGTGAFLVYQSFAFTDNGGSSFGRNYRGPIWCNSGSCASYDNGGWRHWYTNCNYRSSKGGWTCPNSTSY